MTDIGQLTLKGLSRPLVVSNVAALKGLYLEESEGGGTAASAGP